MKELLDHLNEVSVFGHSALALFLILGINFAFSLLHTLQEWKEEEVPLWRNFGAIVGVWIPNWFGFPIFTIGLTAILWSIGLMGVAGWHPLFGLVELPLALGALGALVGARVSDTLVSHILLHSLGYQPNPGLRSTRLYIIEAIFIIVAFSKGLSINANAAVMGFTAGFLFFCFVLPLLWFLRFVVPPWRHDDRWIRGEPLPEWTR